MVFTTQKLIAWLGKEGFTHDAIAETKVPRGRRQKSSAKNGFCGSSEDSDKVTRDCTPWGHPLGGRALLPTF